MNCRQYITLTIAILSLLGGEAGCCVCRAQQTDFILPDIPDTITQPNHRLNYLLRHYWDHYDFADTTAQGRLLGEQGFVDFINILPMADSTTCASATALYLAQALATPESRQHYDQLVTHYMMNRHSPLRNDKIYAHLLRQASIYYSQPERRRQMGAELKRTQFMLENIDRNQVGTLAPDFKFRDTDGKRRKLSSIHSHLTIVMFYDPECEDCHRAQRLMDASPLFKRADIYTLRVLPSQVKRLFYITATPSFYLLDAEHRILLKDATLDQLVAFIQQME